MNSMYKVTKIIHLRRHNSLPISPDVVAQPGDTLELVERDVYTLDRSARRDGVLKVDVPASKLATLLSGKQIQPA